MPSREEFLKWVDETGAQLTRPIAPHDFSIHYHVFSESQIEAFGNRVWNEAIEAAAERLEEQHPWLTKVAASQLVRKLKQGETK